MNHNVYIFGNLSAGYTQFPEDVTRYIFETAAKDSKAKTQISVRRTRNLVYYIYTRFLDDAHGDKFLGIALAFNGVYVNNITSLFRLFEDLLTSIVIEGGLIEFADNGNLVPKSATIHSRLDVVNRIVRRISDEIKHLDSASFRSLPPENYSISVSEQIRINEDDSQAIYEKAIRDYHIINIVRSNATSSDPLNSYSLKLKKLSDSIVTLQKEFNAQAAELNKVRRQKKRTRVVSSLALCIVAIVYIFYNIGSNLTEQVHGLTGINQNLTKDIQDQSVLLTQQGQTLESYRETVSYLNDCLVIARDSISEQESVIEKQSRRIESLQGETDDVRGQLARLQTDVSEAKEKLNEISKERDSYRNLASERLTEIARLNNRISSLETELEDLQPKRRRKR